MAEQSKEQEQAAPEPVTQEPKAMVIKSPVVLRGVKYKAGDKAPVLPEDESALKKLGCI